MAVVSLKDISKNYFFLEVLKDISLELLPGKFYGLLGENGAGKSTLFQIIVGLERASSGESKILGHEIQKLPPELKCDVGIISEKIEFDSPLNMKEFFNFYSGFFPRWNSKLFNEIIQHQSLDLSKPFKKYSRGQKMQMVLAAELSKSPKILLIDEITSVLDVYSRLFYLRKLEEFKNNGGTVFLTTNVITEVESYLDHIFIIKDKRIIFNGPTSSLSNYQCPLVEKKLTLEELFSNLHSPTTQGSDYDKAA